MMETAKSKCAMRKEKRVDMKTCLSIAALMLLLISQPALSQNPKSGPDYDAVRDFSITSNPNGVWSYGWKTGQTPFTLYTVTDTTSVPGMSAWLKSGSYPEDPTLAHNDTQQTICDLTFCVPPKLLHLHPSINNEMSVIRWTAPSAGQFVIYGIVAGLDWAGPTTTDLRVIRDDTQHLMIIKVDSYASPFTFHSTQTLAAGETIDFMVDYGSNHNYYYDSTGVEFAVAKLD
jgi:hypothetical protein